MRIVINHKGELCKECSTKRTVEIQGIKLDRSKELKFTLNLSKYLNY